MDKPYILIWTFITESKVELTDETLNIGINLDEL